MSVPWPMFHHDERHTGMAEGVGQIPRNGPPTKRWELQVAPAVSEATVSCYRFYSGFPLVDLDGHGGLDVIVTGPDNACSSPGVPNLTQGSVRAIRTMTNPLRAEFLWNRTYGIVNLGESGCSDWFDQYSAAAVQHNADPPDIIFTSKRGVVRAVNGQNGDLIWEDYTRRAIEAGPMIADLDHDGQPEIIVVTGNERSRCTPNNAALLIYKARPPQGGTANPPICVIDFPDKLDSQEPAIIDLNPPNRRNSQTLVFGSWDGYLYAVWFDLETNNQDLATADVHVDRISMADIAQGSEGAVLSNERPVVRSSPLIWNFGQGETAVFAWMGDFRDIESSRISAVGLAYCDDADPRHRRVEFTQRWTHKRVRIEGEEWPIMDWKPSVALLPMPGRPPLVVSAGGKGTNASNQTGSYGVCTPDARSWVGAFDRDGNLVWGKKYTGEGNIRASCAVGDLDGDGHYEVVVPFGCRGTVRCYGDDGSDRWSYQLGDGGSEWTRRSIASPSIGDVDGDGFIEVIVSAFDGKVYCLGG